MSWRDGHLRNLVQSFYKHVEQLDEAERQARWDAPSTTGPARRGLPEGPGERAARMLKETEESEAQG